jgi:type II secretory ATPase GspE/PulE/Tfp pilus assembly ATPase PilB-like protein
VETPNTNEEAIRAEAASAPRVLETLIRQAEEVGASDIHIHQDGDVVRVALRMDGLLTQINELPADLGERVLGRIKFLARLKTYQESMPQDGRINKDAVSAISDLRVSTYPTVTGEKAVLRLFNRGELRTLNDLGLPDDCRADLEQVLRQTSGLLLLTGPAGSGKTTTIYACLAHLVASSGRHIITIEDPAEQRIPGVMQTEVNEARGLDFARAARHVLRQDPQVLVIGEIRDEATAGIAVRAALTGHLVITTLHAGSCRGVFERLSTLCADTSAVATCAELVLNQRLLRKLCPQCRGSGCEACLHTGYRGRIIAAEWLRVTDAVRNGIRTRDLSGIAPAQTLQASGDALVRSGATRHEERERVLGS